MTKSETVITAFKELGYKPMVDEDGNVMIRYQMKDIYALIGDKNESYLILILPIFREVEEGKEHVELAVCNKVTRDSKLVKIYVDHDFKSISARCEFFYCDKKSLKKNIEKSLQILGVIKSTYRNAMSEMFE